MKRFFSMMLLVFLLVSSLGRAPAPAHAAGTVRYLSPGGADAADCSLPAQPCRTLQYAVGQAESGDLLYLASGIYSGVQSYSGRNQVAYIDKSLSLYGGYNASYTTRDPQNAPSVLDAALGGRVLYLANAAAVTLDGLQLKNGALYQNGPGIYAGDIGNVLVISNTTISGCQGVSDGQGLGIYLFRGSLELQNSALENNTPAIASNYITGSAIFAQGATVNISATTFADNVGDRGTVYLYETDSAFDEVTFTGNHAKVYGGSIYSYKGSLQIARSAFTGNISSFSNEGGAVWIQETLDAVIEANTFTNNQGSAIFISYNAGGLVIRQNHFEGNTSANGGAIQMRSNFPMQVIDNEFIDNQATTRGGAFHWYYGGAMSNLARQVIFEGNTFQGNQAQYGGAAHVAHGVDFRYNQFIGNHASVDGGALYHEREPRGESYYSVFEGNLLWGNTAGGNGGAMAVYAPDCCNVNQFYENSAFVDNQAGGLGGAIYMDNRVDNYAQFKHATFSGNTASDGSTFYIYFGGVDIFNSMFEDAQVAINNANGGLSLNSVLFDEASVPNQVVYDQSWEAPDPDIRVEGSAGLDVDGYHLTAGSDAIDAGEDLTLTYDIDREPRLFGTAPDLGADESPFSKAAGVSAQMFAGQPQWKINYLSTGAPPLTTFEQTYLISYGNYQDDISVTQYAIESTFPAALVLTSTAAQPEMTYTSDGVQKWISRSGLVPGAAGWAGMTGQSDTIASGTELSASGIMKYTLSDASTGEIPISAVTTVTERPLFPPMLVTPWNGEMCLDESGQLTATGLSSTNVTVRLYEDGALVGSAVPDSKGQFSITWNTSMTASEGVQLYAVACETADRCSQPSKTVSLAYPQGEWCPQRSYWEGEVDGVHYTFHFRNEGGNYTSHDFLVPGLYGFWNTKLHLYSCCQSELNPFHVMADDVEYTTPSGHNGREWIFDIGGAHDVIVTASCSGFVSGDDAKEGRGEVLIDPDGYVFDQSAGGSYDAATGVFSPNQPLIGVTVTAYYWVEEWQTWIPWPAELYDSQINPQVTGPNGYYAFFTPPGKYYLQAAGKDGYQSWRSPEIEVVSEIVHMNSPLTARGESAPDAAVISSPAGLSQSRVTIPVGGSVTWQASVGASATADTFSALMLNPLTRLLSTLNPLSNQNGWDSGMLQPGAEFTHSFNQSGTYMYTDGFGHSGQVVVLEEIYIPVVIR